MKPAGYHVIDANAETLEADQPRRSWPVSYQSVGVIVMTCDVLTILICGVACGATYNLGVFGTPGEITQYLGSAAVVAAFYVSAMKGHGMYSSAELLALKTQIGSVTTAWLGVFLFLFGAVFALKIGDHFSRGGTFSFVIVGLGSLITQRTLYRALLRHGLDGHKFAGRNAILITEQIPVIRKQLVRMLLKYGFRLDRQFVIPHDLSQQGELIADIVAYLRASDIEEVIVSVDLKRWEELERLFSSLRRLPLPVSLIPAGASSDILRRPSHMIGDAVCIELQREPLDAFERVVKRFLDVLIAVAGLILLLPLLMIAAALIKFDSPGPVLFRQRRCGFNGREFSIFKFRTMSCMEDGASISQAVQQDARTTRLGRWLRRASIDELPQLLNVLNGSMSLVGPRPHAVAHNNQFAMAVSNYAFRHHVKPGLTGWAQVNGCRGPTPTIEDVQRRVQFDLWYIDNWSLRLDFVIIIRTFLEIMRARNAY